ncbi:chemotaxis response regulator protein-glutamate methylesterase [Psychrobium sp. 1_MG-2023]|uniref:protein-glutamate methylesterase/protein-glutamine glutaminase n=1 Tax=Psychrobium sp. 1_MG-2023 TaxID=3062624 RepID=UPI000C32E3E2|nr:chemotaxis response regulator protein-glutamate methylesterase [Psychrobium sp. 1_MG-2023]MDP2560152.1 chemotaxis response regulator protein-glutamate methylesterase [Psychrobium sp. 1_MG-2023]PKF56965.1 chemotaxis response regulator protein-glutamate methylesterase [Alteromonadales bacterium alter-6D02]
MQQPIRVLIVDDSKLVREILKEILNQFPDIDVIGAACDAYEARELIKALNPDVITLDVEMPKMDGITFLKNVMRLRPMPVVMLSTLTTKGADVTFEALEVGAVDFIAKPKSEKMMGNVDNFSHMLYEKIIGAASVDIRALKKRHVESQSVAYRGLDANNTIIALGASTGGTEALREVLKQLPINSPPVVVTQHIPESFSLRFAKRLNEHCKMAVKEAADGDVLKAGNVYVAPGNRHLCIDLVRGQYLCRLDDSPAMNRHKPSVDMMFNSLAVISGTKIYSGLLTGMGADGAKGMLALKQNGAYTLIQDKASSMIWGMPGAAFKLNAHTDQSSLANFATTLLNKVNEGATVNIDSRKHNASIRT